MNEKIKEHLKTISRQEIKSKEAELIEAYPMEYMYGSRCSLWLCGLNNGMVSREQFDAAKDYYGRLWNYVGD